MINFVHHYMSHRVYSVFVMPHADWQRMGKRRHRNIGGGIEITIAQAHFSLSLHKVFRGRAFWPMYSASASQIEFCFASSR